MMILKRAWQALVKILRRLFGQSITKDIPAQKRKRRKKADVEDKQEYYFKGKILDNLDMYFKYIGKLKKRDREAYKMHTKLGVFIAPETGSIQGFHLEPWAIKARPSFGAVSLPLNDKGQVQPRAMYFRKYKIPPSEIQRINRKGDVYVGSMYMNEPADEEFPALDCLLEYAVLIDEEGHVSPLRVRSAKRHQCTWRAPVDGSKGNRTHTQTFHQKVWEIPKIFHALAEDKREDAKKTDDDVEWTTETLLTFYFCCAMNVFTQQSNNMMQVRVRKGNLRCIFCVDPKRTAYFFKDRDLYFNDKGTRKRIFHIVRPHKRKGAGGNETTVKMHFRGHKKFTWNGYDIEISIPTRDHFNFNTFDAGALDEERIDEIGTEMPVYMDELADVLEKMREKEVQQ